MHSNTSKIRIILRDFEKRTHQNQALDTKDERLAIQSIRRPLSVLEPDLLLIKKRDEHRQEGKPWSVFQESF